MFCRQNNVPSVLKLICLKKQFYLLKKGFLRKVMYPCLNKKDIFFNPMDMFVSFKTDNGDLFHHGIGKHCRWNWSCFKIGYFGIFFHDKRESV